MSKATHATHVGIASLFAMSLACGDAHPPPTQQPDADAGDAQVAVEAGADAGTDTGTVEYMCATTEVKAGACKAAASGVFAVKIELDVWWKTDLLNPGRGTIVNYLRAELEDVCEDGSSARVSLGMCGIEMPLFRSEIACSAFQLDFSNVDWDGALMPTFHTVGRASGFEPGDSLLTHPTTGLLGIDLDAISGPWPTNLRPPSCNNGQTGGVCFPDHDADGQPGITATLTRLGELDAAGGECAEGIPYTYAGLPLDPSASALQPGSPRAETLALGLRTRIGTDGAISSDCQRGVGDAMAGTLDSFIFDCWAGDGTPCLASQAAFIQDSSPQWHVLIKGEVPPVLEGVDPTPSTGSRALLVRMGDAGEVFDCADVRAVSFDQP